MVSDIIGLSSTGDKTAWGFGGLYLPSDPVRPVKEADMTDMQKYSNKHDDLFWSKVRKGPGCWEWNGYVSCWGYGRFHFSGFHHGMAAHRWAYISANGSIPRGKIIMHTCDNRKCVNPEHLRAGSQHDNIMDCSLKGRHFNGSKALCPSGHPYSGDNLIIKTERGRYRGRGCRTCQRSQGSMRRMRVRTGDTQ